MAVNQGYIINDAGQVFLVDLANGTVTEVKAGNAYFPASLVGKDLTATVAELSKSACLVAPAATETKSAVEAPIMIMTASARPPQT